jgi:hypothetical protein
MYDLEVNVLAYLQDLHYEELSRYLEQFTDEEWSPSNQKVLRVLREFAMQKDDKTCGRDWLISSVLDIDCFNILEKFVPSPIGKKNLQELIYLKEEARFKKVLKQLEKSPLKEIKPAIQKLLKTPVSAYKPRNLKEVSSQRLVEMELEKKAPTTGYPKLDQYIKGFIGGHTYTLSGGTNCIDEDTYIDCQIVGSKSTKPIKVKNLFRHFNEGKEIIISSIDEKTDRVVKNKIKDVFYSGYKDCYEVVVDFTYKNKTRKTKVVTTKDHRFYIGNGEYKQLADLKVGDNIKIRSVLTSKTNKKRVKYAETTVKYHPLKSQKTINNCKYHRIKRAYLVYEAYLNNLSPKEYRNLLNNYDGRKLRYIRKNQEIHHKDNNSLNDRLENLVLINRKGHASLHMIKRANLGEFSRVAISKEIKEINYVGKRHTYDISCESPLNNFIANRFIVHNCGKTQICACFTVAVANQNKKVLYFALEPENTLINYLASIIHNKRFEELTESDLSLSNENIHVFGKDNVSTIEDLLKAIYTLPRYDLIVIDHIGYFTSAGSATTQKQSDVMKQLAGLAKDRQSAILLVQHLNKSKTNKGNPEDNITGSAAFKQDATEVLLLVRDTEEDEYGAIKNLDTGAILVRKTKTGGGEGVVKLKFIEGSSVILDDSKTINTF